MGEWSVAPYGCRSGNGAWNVSGVEIVSDLGGLCCCQWGRPHAVHRDGQTVAKWAGQLPTTLTGPVKYGGQTGIQRPRLWAQLPRLYESSSSLPACINFYVDLASSLPTLHSIQSHVRRPAVWRWAGHRPRLESGRWAIEKPRPLGAHCISSLTCSELEDIV